MIAGTAALEEAADAPPPPHPRVTARIEHRHTTAKACKRMIGKTLSSGSGLNQRYKTSKPGGRVSQFHSLNSS